MEASGGAYFLQSLAAKYEKCAARLSCVFAAVGGVRPGLGGKAPAQGGPSPTRERLSRMPRARSYTRVVRLAK